MPLSHPVVRRLALPVSLLLAAAALMLASPSASLARAHRASCPASHARSRSGARSCSRAGAKGKPSHRRSSTAKPHRAKHAARHKTKGKRTGVAGAGAPAVVPAACEDETAPVAGSTGDFSCDDGSTPSCEGEASPRPAAGGKVLVCPVESEDEEEAGEEMTCEEGSGSLCVNLSEASVEGVCANGSAVALDGSYDCADGSKPSCATGMVPLRSPEGAVVLCLPGTAGDE